MERNSLLEAIIEQSVEFKLRLKKNYVYRKEEDLINLSSPLAQVVIGVRRSGKSTLCFNVIKKSAKNFAYINFDDERFSNLQSDDLNIILEYLYKVYGEFENLFIDEIQNITEWYLFVNRLLRQNMHILITGSNAKLLSGELATHLTGRYMQTELYPFSFSEYCDYKKIDKLFLTTKEKGLLQAFFDQYMHEGGFPELLEESRKQTYINTLVQNILQNDIEKRYSIKYKNAFEKLSNHLLNNAPCQLNYKQLQKLFDFRSDHTAENYVQYLKNAYLIQGLNKFSYKSKIRLRNEKAYLVDVALMNNRENAFEGENLGWRLENLVYIELLRRYKPLAYDVYYYAETSFEADFVVCSGNQVKKIVQVAYDISKAKTKRREINGLLKTSELTKCNDLLLITNFDDGEEKINEKLIKIASAYKWFLSN